MRASAIAGLGLALLGAVVARAEEGISRERFEALELHNQDLERQNEDLERRLSQLEQREQQRSNDQLGPLAEWTRRVRLSGSVNAGYFRGSDETPFEDMSFDVWDARFFLDADLGREIELGETPIARNAGLTFEWNAVRLGEVQGTTGATYVGETYFELQGLGGAHWMNLQLGRFQIPVGENYLRYSKGYRDNPFITNTVGGPWWWDEGVRMYGSIEGPGESRFGWVTSLSDGETEFNDDGSRSTQSSMKLYAEPVPWLHASVSALRSGQIGSRTTPGNGALWLGETWASPAGSKGSLPLFQDGVAVPDAPNEIDSTMLLAGDLILTNERLGRLWLAFGHYDIDAPGGGYDRNLLYWIAEWILEGRGIAPELAPFYLALRANGLGSYDEGKGYLLDIRDLRRFGYNAQSLDAYSAALGWRLTRWSTLRLEYSRRYVGLVDGAPESMRSQAGASNLFGIELGAAF